MRLFQVFGERNSGTNFIDKLIRTNFTDFAPAESRFNFGWKHGGLDWRWRHEKGALAALHDHKRDAPDLVLVVVFREPFDWLASMARSPHHAPFHVGLPLPVFLRMGWFDYVSENRPGEDFDPDLAVRGALARPRNAIERHASIFALRRAKIERFLAYGDWLPHVLYVPYEHVAARQEAFLDLFARLFGGARMPEFAPVLEAKFGGAHAPAAPTVMSAADLAFAAEELSWLHERRAGYTVDFAALETRLATAGHDGACETAGVTRIAEGAVLANRGQRTPYRF